MEFNAGQSAAIRCNARNTLVLAGAGTGKTSTIIGRALHLMETGTEPNRLVIVTFTRRAAGEIRARLTAACGATASRVVAGTFHHFCLRTMSARRRWFGFHDLTLMDRDDQLQLMKLVRGQQVAAEVQSKRAAVPKAAQLVDYYSYARNTNQPAREYLERFTDLDEATIECLLKIFKAYKARKQVNAYMDYDDILHRFARVMHDDAEVRRKVAQQYDHVLVDEMQDTNPLQWLILEKLTEACKLFCVGDDAQSIYAFRGADFRNVHSFQERLPESQVVKLEQNFRSTQPILDVANWLLSQSSLAFDKTLSSVRGDGPRPLLLDFEDEFEESKWIVDSIQARKGHGANWSDHMILCRTAYTARPIEAELIAQQVPYRFVGGIGLLQMAHVRDLLALLRIVVNHRDELAWLRYLTLWPRIGEVTATRIMNQLVATDSCQSAVDVLEEQLPRRQEVVRPLRDVLECSGDASQATQVAGKRLDAILESKYDRWEARRNDFQLLAALAAKHRSIQGFLEVYTLDPISATEVKPTEAAEDGVVTLITVHSAKGAEADVCYVAAVQPGNYPHVRSLGDEDAVEEERRVLYVALTRARDEMFLTRSLSRGYARVSWNAASGSQYFLDNLATGLVDWDAKMSSSTFDYDDDVIG